MTRQEWRDFGLYYLSNDEAREWHLHGGTTGLIRLAEALERYAADPNQAAPGEHEHLGPHWYLTITTWPEPRLDDRGIWGETDDFERLAGLLRGISDSGSPGQTYRIREQFVLSAEYSLIIHFEPETFDPASLDPQLTD